MIDDATNVCSNAFLQDYYLPKMNGKFSRPASDAADAHAPLGDANLKSNKALPRPKSKVLVRVLLDGTLQIIWKDAKLLVKELTNTQDPKMQKVA